jgi:hypothetical protein
MVAKRQIPAPLRNQTLVIQLTTNHITDMLWIKVASNDPENIVTVMYR